MFRGSVKSTVYPLHSPVPASLPLPCVTMCHHISTGLYYRRLEDCQTSIEDDPRSGRPAAATEDDSTERVPDFHSFKSTVSSAGAGRQMSSVSRKVSYLLKGTVKRALCRSRIHSASADRRPEGANAVPSVKNCVIKQTKKKTL
jgi:hypothetical protein